jgi:hypothetical protein
MLLENTSSLKKSKNLILTVVALVVLLLAIIATPLPVPGTTLAIALSITSLIITSPRAKKLIILLRVKIKFINKSLVFIEEKLKNKMPKVSNTISSTNPNII